MSMVSPYNNYTNSYYSLGSSSADTASGAASSSTTGTAAAATGSSTDAFLLNLSAEAQSYLSGNASGSSHSATEAKTTVSHFSLNESQQKTIESILAKYKDAPYDQTTYDDIQNDLDKAGLSPDTLAAVAQTATFNSTTTLIDALNGKDVYQDSSSGSAGSSNTVDYSAAKTNFMKDILSGWQNVSSAYAADETASESSSAA